MGNGEANILFFIRTDFPILMNKTPGIPYLKHMDGLWVVCESPPEIYSFDTLLSTYYVMDTLVDVSLCVR